MGKTIIFIWGGAILLYLLVNTQNSAGTASLLKNLQSFVSGTTSTLQGR